MAAAVTLLGTQTFNTTSGTHTVVATPAAGDLIVLVVANTGYTGTVLPTDNNSDGLGAYTLVATAVKATSADTMQFYVRNNLIASPTSTTFTHAPGTTTGGGLGVFKITGMGKAGSSAIRQSAKQDNQASSTTPTPVLGSAALTTNALIGAVFNATSPATLTPRTSWTETFDVGYSTPTTGLETMTRNSGETATSIAWGGTSGSAFCSIVIELDTTHSGTSTITDTFSSGSSPDATKWYNYGLTNITVSGGLLNIATNSGAAGAYFGMNSTALYDLTSSSALVQVVSAGNQSLVSLDCGFVVEKADLSGDDQANMFAENGNLIMRSRAATVNSDTSITYNASTHAWWRIRESGGTVFFDTSPDGTTWTNQRSVASPFSDKTSVHVSLYAGTFASEATTSNVQFDNVNTPPVASSTPKILTLLGVG